MTTFVPSRHWRVCAMSVGPSTTGVRFFGESFVRRITPMLLGLPVAICERPGLLDHPHDDELEACTVGRVLTASFMAKNMTLLATVVIDSPRAHYWLLQHERAGLLRKGVIGVSLYFIDPVVNPGLSPLDYFDARAVRSLDLVTQPASPGARVLRSVPAPKEKPTP